MSCSKQFIFELIKSYRCCFFFFLTVEKRKLQDKVDEKIRLGERETALVRLCCPFSRADVNHFAFFRQNFYAHINIPRYSCLLFLACILTTQCATPIIPIKYEIR